MSEANSYTQMKDVEEVHVNAEDYANNRSGMETPPLYEEEEEEDPPNKKAKLTEAEKEIKDLGFDDPNEMSQIEDSFCTVDTTEKEEEFFEVIPCERIMQLVDKIVLEVSSILDLPPTYARFLLHNFGWDKNKLTEAYFDGDKDALFKKIKLPIPSSILSLSDSTTSNHEDVPELCEICYVEKAPSQMKVMTCMHRFCVTCWSQYVKSVVLEDNVRNGGTISCPAHQCQFLIDDNMILELDLEPDVKQRYQKFILKSFVLSNPLMKWCPGLDCSSAVSAQLQVWKPVTCPCGCTFCFLCSKPWHAPVKCELLKKWERKSLDDSGIANFIVDNTKECPRCQVFIEKDRGCDLMTCGNCQAQFCWICLRLTDDFRHECNDSEDDDENVWREPVQATHQGYFFYFKRYTNHSRTLQWETKSLQSKLNVLTEGVAHKEHYYLKMIAKLRESRQTLMYTYIFAYFLAPTSQSKIFLDNQADLEAATEKLSHFLKNRLTKSNWNELSKRIQDQARYCDGRRKALIDHVNEGYQEDFWEYI